MNSFERKNMIHTTIFLLPILLLLSTCQSMSETTIIPSAGLNGSFEVVEKGLPVNWLFYTSKTVKEGNFTIISDESDKKEGLRSVTFQVTTCSSEGGRFSPGMATEIEVKEKSVYILSFWVKNQQSKFKVIAGGVTPFTKETKVLIESGDSFTEWKQFLYEVPISENFNRFRVEVSVLSPGTFSIDDVRITLK